MQHKTIKSKAEICQPFPEIYVIDADEKISRAIIESLKQKKFDGKVAVFGRDNDFNRRALETLKINYLISPEKRNEKDTLKQRDSGLNHVLAKIARDKRIGIVIDFDDWNSVKDAKQKALRLARIIQNVKICRKAKCPILIWSLSKNLGERELESFGFSLGMSSEQLRIKDSMF